MTDRTNSAQLTQSELLLPLLEAVADLGCKAPAGEVIDAVSSRLGVPDSVKNDFRLFDFGTWGTRKRSVWRQKLHWVRLTAVTAGLLERGAYGYWTLSEKGRGSLVKCQPGVILTVYETPAGEVVWADAVTAAGTLGDNSINLLFSSPPYPLAGNGRKYGNISPAETVGLLVKCAHEWRRALTDDGSIVLNLRDVWLPKEETGGAERSLYQEKLLVALVEECNLRFCDRFIWKNPSCMGDSWVTVRRVRTTLNFETLFWLSKGPNPKADNRRVLMPAAESTLATYRQKARTGQQPRTCPSGHKNIFSGHVAAVAAGQTISVIPRNVLEFTNSDPRKALHGCLDALHLPHHDAVMPPRLAKHFIEFLTERNDLVADPFWGSGVTGFVAEQLGRGFVGSDHCLAHVLGSAARWPAEAISYGAAFA